MFHFILLAAKKKKIQEKKKIGLCIIILQFSSVDTLVNPHKLFLSFKLYELSNKLGVINDLTGEQKLSHFLIYNIVVFKLTCFNLFFASNFHNN